MYVDNIAMENWISYTECIGCNSLFDWSTQTRWLSGERYWCDVMSQSGDFMKIATRTATLVYSVT